MAIPTNSGDLELKKFKESTATSGQPGVVALNPDGTNIGASTADGSTFTAGTTPGNIIEAVYESSPSTVADGKAGAVGMDSTRGLITNPKALSKTIDSVESRPEGTTYVNLTASANATRTGPGILVGMYVNSTSSGTILFRDSLLAASGTVINNTITPSIGYHPLGNAYFSTGLSETIGGTLDVTLYYIPVAS